MKRQFLTLFICSFYFITTAFSQTEYIQNIHFDSDKSVVNESNKKLIDNLVKQVGKHDYSEITIVGHTDQDGSDIYNQKLSRKRAQAVKSILISKGIDPDVIAADWKGEKELAKTDNSSQSKKLNRRVTLVANVYDFENSSDILTSMHNVQQNITTIDPKKEQSITCIQGTIVNIPAYAFELEDGTPISSKNIKIEIKEAFTYADFVAEGLFTHSKSDILETGGMIYVNATSEGKQVKLKEGQSIEVLYPAQYIKEGMELFYANYDDNNQIDWEPTSQPFASTTAGTSAYDYEIDWDVLLNFKYEETIDKPSLSFTEMAAKPSLGHKPFPPSKPIKPTLENTTLQLSTMDNVLKGKKKKAELKKVKYEEALIDYDKKLIKYKENYKNYLVNLDNYKKAIPKKEEDIKKWNAEVNRRIAAVTNYKRDLKKFHVYVQIKGVSKKIRNEIGKRSNKELLNLFNAMMQSPITLELNERKLFRKVFGNQTKRILDERKIYPKDIDFHHENNKNVFPYIADIISLAKKQATEKEFEETGKIDNGDFGKYLTNISQLGWINCDRFRNFPERLMANIYLEDDDSDAKYYLIFTDMKSMLPAKRSKDKNSYVIANLPKNKKVKIVGVKLKNNEPQLSVIDHKISDENFLAMNFSPATLKDIRTELNSTD